MPATTQQPTAKIYAFPTKTAAGRAVRESPRFPAKPAMPQPCDAASGSGWYHEAALREDEGQKS